MPSVCTGLGWGPSGPPEWLTEGGLGHVSPVMTAKPIAARLTAGMVSQCCCDIDIVSGCKDLGSLLMRAVIDQVIIALL